MKASFQRVSGKFGVLVTSSVLAAFVACTGPGEQVSGAPPSPSDDAGAPDLDLDLDPDPDASAGADAADARRTATDYCESIVAPFCAFYIRCGRMAAKDEAECRSVLLETCNAKYEPRYVDLEHAGLITLSEEGIDACAAHLEQVSCVEQVQDLDGPCARMWIGSSPETAPCGFDVESLVCSAGTTCVLGPDFCGTCEKAAPRGAACVPGTTRCTLEDACVSGTCVARALRGQACSDAKPCVVGSTCSEGTCVGPVVVGEGDACDAQHRCPYRSYCDAGKCARASLLGEPCTSTRACASGFCDDAKCVAPKGEGDACDASAECSSAQCTGGKCTPLPTACIRR